MTRKAIAYYRVSTVKQGVSGLGLEGQQTDVRRLLSHDNYNLVAEFTEVESGRRNDRKELAKALQACRIHRATLVVSRLDRLSRNATFLLNLLESGVEVRFADMPNADKLFITVMAAIAEWEAGRAGERTRAALKAARSRGVRLGTPANLTKEGARRGTHQSVAVRQQAAKKRAEDMRDVITELQAAGITSYRKLAWALTKRGIQTPRGKATWSASQVRSLLSYL